MKKFRWVRVEGDVECWKQNEKKGDGVHDRPTRRAGKKG